MWKGLLIKLAFSTVCSLLVQWARIKGKPWADDLEKFCHEIKTTI